MRAFWFVAPSLALIGCAASPQPLGSPQHGRYQQISNPPPTFCPPLGQNTMPPPGCGLVILDTLTGAIFIHEATDWREEDPHTGKIAIHDLRFQSDK
jgi:hypothetical protein